MEGGAPGGLPGCSSFGEPPAGQRRQLERRRSVVLARHCGAGLGYITWSNLLIEPAFTSSSPAYILRASCVGVTGFNASFDANGEYSINEDLPCLETKSLWTSNVSSVNGSCIVATEMAILRKRLASFLPLTTLKTQTQLTLMSMFGTTTPLLIEQAEHPRC